MNTVKKGLMALALVGAMGAVQAQAATVSPPVTADGWDTWTISGTFGGQDGPTSSTVSCPTGACTLMVVGDLGNSNPDTEVGLLNTVLDPDISSEGYTQIDDSVWFDSGSTVSGQYFMLKFGDLADVWFRNNWFPESTEVTVVTGNAMGLSHVTTTPPSEVPLPGTLGLLGLGLAGLGAIRRKKQDA